jgi:hypothetical protein
MELLYSQFDPQANPLGKKQKLGVNGIGKKAHKKSWW